MDSQRCFRIVLTVLGDHYHISSPSIALRQSDIKYSDNGDCSERRETFNPIVPGLLLIIRISNVLTKMSVQETIPNRPKVLNIFLERPCSECKISTICHVDWFHIRSRGVQTKIIQTNIINRTCMVFGRISLGHFSFRYKSFGHFLCGHTEILRTFFVRESIVRSSDSCRVSWTREVLPYMDKSTWKEHPPYTLLVILEGVIVY
jgi:hypothetical protein